MFQPLVLEKPKKVQKFCGLVISDSMDKTIKVNEQQHHHSFVVNRQRLCSSNAVQLEVRKELCMQANEFRIVSGGALWYSILEPSAVILVWVFSGFAAGQTKGKVMSIPAKNAQRPLGETTSRLRSIASCN